MPGRTPDSDLDLEWAFPIIEREVRAFLKGSAAFTCDDADDLVAESLVHWWQQRHRYDGRRGASRETFLKRITQNKLKDIYRRRVVEQRRFPMVASNEEFVSVGGPDVSAERNELARRVRLVYRQLSIGDQRVLADWGDGRTVTESASGLGISRQAVYRRRDRLRTVFANEGLKDYFD